MTESERPEPRAPICVCGECEPAASNAAAIARGKGKLKRANGACAM